MHLRTELRTSEFLDLQTRYLARDKRMPITPRVALLSEGMGPLGIRPPQCLHPLAVILLHTLSQTASSTHVYNMIDCMQVMTWPSTILGPDGKVRNS